MSMEFIDKLNSLSAKIKQQAGVIETEEATKNAFVMPFINNVLGYDVFDPTEVIPEFVCDIGTKKGEKIDYAILKNSEVQILIECKKNWRSSKYKSCFTAFSILSCNKCKNIYSNQWTSL